VGNAENATALEMTLVGGAFEFETDAVIALTRLRFQRRPATVDRRRD